MLNYERKVNILPLTFMAESDENLWSLLVAL